MTTTEMIESKAKELLTIRNGRKPANEEDWYFLEPLLIDYRNLAKHVLAGEIRAKINAISFFTAYNHEVDKCVRIDALKQINELTEQLKELI